MEFQSFFNGDFLLLTNFITLSLLFHYIIMENKSNENLMENQNICSNSIKSKVLFSLAFHKIDFDWVYQ